jgi:hypothetical protein
MSDYRNASFDELHAAEKNAQRNPLRRPLRGLTVVAMSCIPEAWEVEIPGHHWEEDRETEEIVVRCKCTAEVRLDAVLVPVACEGCPRFFLYDGTNVRVALTPAEA